MEAELAERAAAGRLRASIVRAGDFYGAGSGNWFDQAIVKDLARGKLVYPGPLDVVHAWAYLPDLARAFVAVAGRPDAPAFEDLHFAGHACTGAELLAGIEAAAGARGLHPAAGWQRSGMPWGLIRAVGSVYPLWRELARMRYLWQVPHALDGAALAQATGPLRETPLAQALQAAVTQAIGYRAAAPRPAPAA
jgi:nucleoside-diphosphate-sugar epimerase